MKITLDIAGLHGWFGGDQRAVVDLVRLMDQRGIYQVCLGDHVIMGEDVSAYPFGKFHAPPDYPWIEPLMILAAIAACTSHIRLNTGVLLSPLRPAPLLAKQLASLDVLSRGRLDIGVGTGWQKAEYEASNLPFEQRAELMFEQIRVCQLLWSTAPASFQGKFHAFERLYSYPQPVQPEGIPVWFGVPPSARNFAQIADIGRGWMPLGLTDAQIAAGVQRLRTEFAARGRDPNSLAVSHIARTDKGLADVRTALQQIPALTAMGVTHLRLFPAMSCAGPQEFAGWLDELQSV